MTARATFRQDDVTRAIKGVLSANIGIKRVKVWASQGLIDIETGTPDPSLGSKDNPWDIEFDAP